MIKLSAQCQACGLFRDDEAVWLECKCRLRHIYSREDEGMMRAELAELDILYKKVIFEYVSGELIDVYKLIETLLTHVMTMRNESKQLAFDNGRCDETVMHLIDEALANVSICIYLDYNEIRSRMIQAHATTIKLIGYDKCMWIGDELQACQTFSSKLLCPGHSAMVKRSVAELSALDWPNVLMREVMNYVFINWADVE